MAYTFRIIFSGPCAYVPNIVEGDSGPAKSWSVALPYLRDGWSGEKEGDQISADHHLAVVQFSEAEFHASVPPDIRVAIRKEDGSYRESGLYVLDGHRITFDCPGAEELKVVEYEIDPKVMSSQSAVLSLIKKADPKIKSMSWLPAMKWLYKDLQWFGKKGVQFFRPNGFPLKGTIAGHVLLKHGALVAHEIDTVPTKAGSVVPTIWEFRSPKVRSSDKNPRQALAKSIALEVHGLEQRVAVTVAYSPQVRKTLMLKAEYCTGEVEIHIKNREFDEIFLGDTGEFEPQKVDYDFRYMYTQAQGYNPKIKNYPLPCLLEGGDAGNESGTCGGHTFGGYAKRLKKIVSSW